MDDRDHDRWQAHWIWGLDDDREENQYRVFRSAFDNGEQNAKTELHITADSRYVVFLNGERLGQGPPRSWPSQQTYDTYDITGRLTPGRNILAVLVHYLGVSNFQYIAGTPGLLCQVSQRRANGDTLILTATNARWRTTAHPAYKRQVPRICVQLGFEEQFDARHDLIQGDASWMYRAFEDSHWDYATVRGHVGIEPWLQLIPRDIPFLTQEPVYPKSLVRARYAKTTPYAWNVDLRRIFAPEKRDANRQHLSGALVFNLHCEEQAQMEWHTTAVYGCGGQVYVNGVALDPSVSQPISVALRSGDNLVVIDLTGEWHDLVMPLAFWSDANLCVTALEPAAVSDSSGTSDTQDTVPIYWYQPPEGVPTAAAVRLLKDLANCGSLPELTGDSRFAAALRPVPDSAILGSIFAETAYARPAGSEEPYLANAEHLGSAAALDTTVNPSPDGHAVQLLLDFGREIVGFLEFELSASTGAILDFNCFEGIQEGRWLFTERLNNTMRYTTRSGWQRFRSHVRRGFRYALITIRNLSEPLYIHELRCLLNTYPVDTNPVFEASDSRLNAIWAMSQYTSRLCSEDTFVDCPAYEQAFWVGDARNEALIDYYINGDMRLARRSLELVVPSLQRSELPESQVPSGWQNILSTWSLLWVLACAEHYRFSGDDAFLERVFPAMVQTCRTFVDKHLNSQGLLEIEAWNMLDWAGMDTPNRGVVTHLNAWLVKALRTVSGVVRERSAADHRAAQQLAVTADEVQAAMNKHLWDDTQQAFVDSLHADGSVSSVISQQTNAVVYLCDCVEGERRALLQGYITDAPSHWVQIGSPFMMFFTFESLVKYGDFATLMQWTRQYWGMMLDRGATTCWEMFPGFERDRWTRSHCHAWSAAPGYFLPAFILGVRPLTPGWNSILIEPQPVDLTWCRGLVPTPHGYADVRWSREHAGELLHLDITLPPGTSGVVRLPDSWPEPQVVGGQAEPQGRIEGQWTVKVLSGEAVCIVVPTAETGEGNEVT